MKIFAKCFVIVLLMLLVSGCDERADNAESGVLLEVEFVNFPIRLSVNTFDVLQIETIEIDSIVVNPNRPTSSLMNIALETMEVNFFRVDGGSRVPVPYVANLIGTVPVGGTLTYTDLPIMSVDQLRNEPLSDLLFVNGAFDKETGENVITINAEVRVFGRTLNGDSVASVPRSHRFEFVP